MTIPTEVLDRIREEARRDAEAQYPAAWGPSPGGMSVDHNHVPRKVHAACYERLKVAEWERERWIPVEERLPEEKVNVLVAGFAYNDPKRGYWQAIGARWDNRWAEDAEDVAYWQRHPVTHWKPLPQGPNTK